MARQRRLSFEFKRNVVLDFLERRQGTRELARKHSLSRKLIRVGSKSTKRANLPTKCLGRRPSDVTYPS
jgi:transposase-like protein